MIAELPYLANLRDWFLRRFRRKVFDDFFFFVSKVFDFEAPLLELVLVPLVREDVPVPVAVRDVVLDYELVLLAFGKPEDLLDRDGRLSDGL